MKLSLKTLNQQMLTVDIGDGCLVADLVTLVEDKLGKDCLYRMIHAGKLLQEDHSLSEYGVFGSKLPVIVMSTKLGPRHRTDSEDSGFGDGEEELEEAEDVEVEGGHFVTETEFKIALEVVKVCDHLNRGDSSALRRPEMEILIENKLKVEEEVKKLLLGKMEMIEEACLSKHRFEAFANDIQSIYEESRNEPPRPGTSSSTDYGNSSSDEMEVSEESDVEDYDFDDDKVVRITNMGFTEQDAINALAMNGNNLYMALEQLVPSERPPSPIVHPRHNPLEFLRDIEEFQFLRYLVLQDPELLRPLLIKFGQSHPQLMGLINDNKDLFVSMIHEQTGAKRHGRH